MESGTAARARAQAKIRLSRRERKVLDALCRQFAKQLAADGDLSFDQALAGIIRLRERGFLTFKYDATADRFSLEPAVGGQPLDDLPLTEGR